MAHQDKNWLKKRLELLEREKKVTHELDAIAKARREMEPVKVKEYTFMTAEGERTLAQLFGDKSQLVVQHLMFDDKDAEGCGSCSFWLDVLNGCRRHFAARDAAFVVVARAPIEKLEAFRARMDWRDLVMASSHGTTFNDDMGVTIGAPVNGEVRYGYSDHSKFPGPGEAPGLSTFLRKGRDVFHFYSFYGRGIDLFNACYQVMDALPKGRDEAGLPYTMSWLKKHDMYGTPPPPAPIAPELASTDAAAHISWIEKVMLAKASEAYKTDEGKIMHVALRWEGGEVYLCDAGCMGGPTAAAPTTDAVPPVVVHVNTVDADGMWNRAIENGAKSLMDISDVFWSARYGRIIDPYGVTWAICGKLHTKPVEQEEPEEPSAKKVKKN